MDILVVLLVLLINLVISFGLIGLSYLLAIRPLQEQVTMLAKSLTKLPTQMPRMQAQSDFYVANTLANYDLPDIEDIPEECFYGDEPEDNKTTPEDVEDAIAERPYTNYNRPQTTSTQQLGSLKM
jgi:hypothetical protein